MDLNRLRTEIEAGNNAKEIMAAMGIKNIQSIRNVVLRLSFQDKKLYEVKRLFGDGNRDGSLKFGKSGLTLSKTRLESLGFKVEDKFDVVGDNGNIVLKKKKNMVREKLGETISEFLNETTESDTQI
ncbi:hypothetical protein N9174_03815 [bacterium]|nr:hypothetical protein [bacterium]